MYGESEALFLLWNDRGVLLIFAGQLILLAITEVCKLPGGTNRVRLSHPNSSMDACKISLQGGAFFTFGNAVRTVILGFGVAHFVYDERMLLGRCIAFRLSHGTCLCRLNLRID